jgi:trk system potassium uptake protein TrkH
VTTFVVVYIFVVLIGTLIYTFFGCDLMRGFSAAIANVSNVGPGFGDVGSMDNYSELPSVLKLNSTILMLIGRLEIFGFLQIFFLNSWR